MKSPRANRSEDLFHGHTKDWIESAVSAVIPYAIAAFFVFAYHEQWF
ncbi:MAG: hypothetical protein FWD62_15285 [Betaproteobacteria bacterium]|nr:hypothetical protein [Betaproteobacteria bacterium]